MNGRPTSARRAGHATRRGVASGALVAALALVATACAARAAESAQCAYSDQCAAGLVCAGGACRAACRTDRDCAAPGTRCGASGRSDAPRACVPRDAPPLCLYHGDCAPPLVCARDGVCRPECAHDRDCAVRAPWLVGATCVGGACVTTTAATGPAPRLLAPLSGSVVPTAVTTVLRVAPAPAFDAVEIELCADRACAMPQSLGVAARTDVPWTPPMQGVVYWRAWGHVGGQRTAQPSAVWELSVRPGVSAAGPRRVGAGFDANGDGAPDFVVAATSSPTAEPRLFVYAGARGMPFDPTAPQMFGADLPIDATGTSFACPGDANGDGFDDVYVAVPTRNQVVLYIGGASGVNTSAMPSSYAPFYRVASAGDVNRDGQGDAVVSAQPTNQFAIILSRSRAAPEIQPNVGAPPEASAAFGSVAAGAGDVNGDGFDDVVVGDPAQSAGMGAAYLFLGGDAGLRTTPALTLRGDGAATGRFGIAVVGAGDVNGDGFADLVVRDTVAVPARRVWLFAGAAGDPPTLARTAVAVPDPDAAVATNDTACAALGDVEGDGYADFALSGQVTNAAGFVVTRVYVFRGGAAGPSLAATIDDPMAATGGSFGASLAGPGDVDGDGAPELLVGAPGNDRVYVFAGSAMGVQAPARFVVTSPLGIGIAFGSVVAP